MFTVKTLSYEVVPHVAARLAHTCGFKGSHPLFYSILPEIETPQIFLLAAQPPGAENTAQG